MPPRIEFTVGQQNEFVARYEAGVPVYLMARELGVHFRVVERVLRTRGVYEPGRKFQGRWTDQQKREVVDRYLAGETQMQLAAAFDCHRTNIHYFLKSRKIPLRPALTYPIDSASEALLRQRRAEAVPFVDIARELGIPKHRALQWGRQLGLSDFIPKRGASSPAWQGGEFRNSQGYWYVGINASDPFAVMRNANGYVLKSRYVVACALGRPLTAAETVHHINTDKSDNRLENLQLRRGSHGTGGAFECLDCGSRNIHAVPLATPRELAVSAQG